MRSGSLTWRLTYALATVATATVLSGAAAVRCEAAPTSAPLADTNSASNVTSTSAVLHGRVNPHGTPTNYVFQYGLTRGYGGQTPLASAGAGTSAVKVSQAIAGLRPDTTYHYRLVAVGAGTSNGSDHTFKTERVPLSLTIRPTHNPVVFGNSFVLTGALSGSRNAGRRVALRVNPYPFARFAAFGAPAITSPTGTFSFFVPGLAQNSQLRVTTTSGTPSASSLVVLERVAVRVSLHVRRTARRGYVRLYGTVAPAESRAQVAFQRLRRDRRWVTESGTIVRPATVSTSRFSRVVRLRNRGLYRALVTIADPSHVAGHSAAVRIR